MRIDLPSGHCADLRPPEDLLAKDGRAAKAAFHLVMREDGARELTGDLTDKIKYALLKELIVGWDFTGLPLPKDAVDPDAVLGAIPLRDMNKLLEAVQPHFDEVMEVEDPKAKEQAEIEKASATA